jgi:hypothetical protein
MFIENMIISFPLVDLSMKISCEDETGFVGHAVLTMLLHARNFVVNITKPENSGTPG